MIALNGNHKATKNLIHKHAELVSILHLKLKALLCDVHKLELSSFIKKL